jgi:formylglycine-generating enzyme required for sulfatase activity
VTDPVSVAPTKYSPGQELAWIPGGEFVMGSDKHYPEEGAAYKVTVDPFWIDRVPVTNQDFLRFVKVATAQKHSWLKLPIHRHAISAFDAL